MINGLMRWFGYAKVRETRAFKAAQSNRLRSSWASSISSINQDIRNGISPVRARAREAVQNNDYAKGYLLKNRSNILGPGRIKLQCNILKKNVDVYAEPGEEDFDERAIRMIEAKFKDWGRAEFCTMQGTSTMGQVQDLMVMYLRRDGEFIAREVKGPKVNKYGYSLDILDPEDLDDQYNAELSNGNTVLMGVEVNEWRKPVAFYFNKKKPIDDIKTGALRREHWRVPAEEIIHIFDREYIKQTRAVSPMVQSLISLKMLDEWEDKSLINATLAASHMGFFTKQRLEAERFTGDEDTDNEYEYIMDYEAGSWRELPYGYDIRQTDSKYPHEQHQPFVKSTLRRIATGLGISYNSLSNDLEGVSYSNFKAGRLDERDVWRFYQNLLIEGGLSRMFENWLQMAILTGQVEYGYSDYERLRRHSWLRRGWREVEPLKQASADRIRVEMNTETISNIIAEDGRDFDEVLYERARELKKIKKVIGYEPPTAGGESDGSEIDGAGETGEGSGDTAGAGEETFEEGNNTEADGAGRGKPYGITELQLRI